MRNVEQRAVGVGLRGNASAGQAGSPIRWTILSLILVAFVAGCATQMTQPRLDIDLSQLPADIFIEEEMPELFGETPDVDELVRRAVERDPRIAVLREAANVAWAQTRTYMDLRDPELGVSFGKGTRVVERSWLVPRAEIMPLVAYPSRGLFLTTEEENLAVSTDPRVPRVLVPKGEEDRYLERSSKTYRGTASDSDLFRASIRFFPPNPWITRSRGAAAQANYAAVLSDLYNEEWRLRCRVLQRMARLQYLGTDLEQLNELVAVRKAMSDNATELAAQRQVPAIEAVTAAQRHLQALSDADLRSSEIAALRNELEALVGYAMPVGGNVYPEEVPTTVEAARRMNLRRRTLESRRDIASAYWRAQVAQAVLSQARATRIPWFTNIQGSYGRSNRRDRPDQAWELGGGYADLDTDTSISIDETEDSEWRIETTVIIPLFSLGARATRVQEAECKRAVAELGAVAREAMQSLTDALALLESAEKRDAMVLDELAPRFAQTQELLRHFRDRGGFGPGEQMQLKEVAIDMLRMSARSRFELIEAALRLEEMIGAPMEPVEEPLFAVEDDPAIAPAEQEPIEENPPEAEFESEPPSEIRRPARLRRGIHR